MELLLDTQNNCFLCLQTIPESIIDNCRKMKGTEMCLRNICRYLKINSSDVLLHGLKERHRDAFNLLKDSRFNFSVNLCNRCYGVTGKLSHLIQDLELVHLKVNYYTELFERILEEASDSTNREIGKNAQLLTPDAQVVEYLREKAKQKCSSRRKTQTSSWLPVVRLKRLDCELITAVTQVTDGSADDVRKLENNLESHLSSNLESEDEHCSDLLTEDAVAEVHQTPNDLSNTSQIDKNLPTINSCIPKTERDVTSDITNAALVDVDPIENNLQSPSSNAIQLEDECVTTKAVKVASEHTSANDISLPNTCTEVRKAASELNNLDGNILVLPGHNNESSDALSFLNISRHPDEAVTNTRDLNVTSDVSYNDSTINLEPIFDHALKLYFCELESPTNSQCILCEWNTIKKKKASMKTHLVCRHPEKLLSFAKRVDIPEAAFEKLCRHVIEKEVVKFLERSVQPRRFQFVCYLCKEVVCRRLNLKNHIVTSHTNLLSENLCSLQGNKNNWLSLMNSDSTHTFNSQLKERQNPLENECSSSTATAALPQEVTPDQLHYPDNLTNQIAAVTVNMREPSSKPFSDSPRHSIEDQENNCQNTITQCSEMQDNPGPHRLETFQTALSCILPVEIEQDRKKRKIDEVNNVVVSGSSLQNLETFIRGTHKSVACPHCDNKRISSRTGKLRLHMLRFHPDQIFLPYKQVHRSESEFANSCRIIFNSESLAYINDRPGAGVKRECAYCTETRRYKIDYLDHLVRCHKEILAEKITALESGGNPDVYPVEEREEWISRPMEEPEHNLGNVITTDEPNNGYNPRHSPVLVDPFVTELLG